jgi:dihydrodipicolinate synthase/N-acetylneuraminate lyase
MGRILTSENLKATTIKEGLIVPTLTPFDRNGTVMMRAVTDQARRLSLIDGVLGIAVNTTLRERQSLCLSERLDVLRHTRDGLDPSQLVLACVDELSGDKEDEIAACFKTGADAVVTFPIRWQDGLKTCAFNSHVAKRAALVEQLPLPIIAVRSNGQTNSGREKPEISTLTSYIAPHEVTALCNYSCDGRFHDARAVHNRLSPLASLLTSHDQNTRELIYREIAHKRGLLASTNARGLTKPLPIDLCARVHKILDEIALKPINWI